MELKSNIFDTALIFEGGGMRASFTSGIVNTLLENELYFNYIAGISAGSSCTLNYLSRDKKRTKASFVDFVKDPEFGGWRTFLRGKGFSMPSTSIVNPACPEVHCHIILKTS